MLSRFKLTPPEHRPVLVLAVLAMSLSLVLGAGYLVFLFNTAPSYNDFFVFWSAAHYLRQMPLASIYDGSSFHAFMLQATDGYWSQLPFVYPPDTALLFAPLAVLSYPAGLLLWNTLSLLLFLGALRYSIKPPISVYLIAMGAPATLINLSVGQTGLLTAALALLGCGLLRRKPAAGGIALGLLTLKPQLALLPCATLLTAGRYRACLAAVATIALLGLCSVLAFGAQAWPAWLASLNHFSDNLATSGRHLQYGVSVYFTLLNLGIGRIPALTIQAAVGVAVLWAVTRTMRRGIDPPQIMALLAGMFLATPYAVVYDMPVISAVCLMLAVQGGKDGFRPGETFTVAAAWLLPLFLLVPSPPIHALSMAVMAGLFVLCLRRAVTTGPNGAKRYL